MASPRVLSEQRRASRAPLNLPLRIRWQGPLGQSVETAETLDVSRTGLLFYRTQPMPVCARLWVVYPFSKENAASLPETPARVVRVKTTPGGGQLVAVEFQPLRSAAVPVEVANRRRGQRTPVALAMSIRTPGVPWGEEAMTLDVSDGGMRFTTPRQYRVGETVRVALAGGRWAAAQGELAARVVRVEPVPGSVEHHVALRLEHP
jgi:hypothetical protein